MPDERIRENKCNVLISPQLKQKGCSCGVDDHTLTLYLLFDYLCGRFLYEQDIKHFVTRKYVSKIKRGEIAMKNIAFIFPGQGAQFPGMGKAFYDTFAEAKEVYKSASDVCGMDIADLCFGSGEQLNITRYTQVAIFTTTLAILRVVERMGIKPVVNAGLSLGEYTALASSKVMNENALFELVKKRGTYMQEAYPTGGAMAAVMGLSDKIVEEICGGRKGTYIANYNCPGQIVITGEKTALESLYDKLEAAGARRVIPLNVSGPFHSPLLATASEKLEAALSNVQVNNFEVPYVTNVTADYIYGPENVKSLLCRQVVSSVMWQQSIENMIAKEVDCFVEIGPGRTLSNFLKKINPKIQVANVEKLEDLENLNKILL